LQLLDRISTPETQGALVQGLLYGLNNRSLSMSTVTTRRFLTGQKEQFKTPTSRIYKILEISNPSSPQFHLPHQKPQNNQSDEAEHQLKVLAPKKFTRGELLYLIYLVLEEKGGSHVGGRIPE
jgi:hypothetical protein